METHEVEPRSRANVLHGAAVELLKHLEAELLAVCKGREAFSEQAIILEERIRAVSAIEKETRRMP